MNRDSKNRNTLSNRREFLASTTALAAFTIIPRHVLAQSGEQAPSDRMNIGCVGVGGMQGGNDVRSVSSENIYALCDVDENHLNQTAMKYEDSHPKLYRDFRVMLDREYKNLDGITITIPDHMHSTVALWAMERGLRVLSKPLINHLGSRLLSKAAKKYNVVTQMGNWDYPPTDTRRCEIIWAGNWQCQRVHSSGGGFHGCYRMLAAEEVPDTLMWDLWTGRAREHCYSSKIHPINWRGFQEYGSQMVGDWGIHMLGPANWALQLDSPVSVECTAVKGVNPVTYPHYSCKMEFPERPNQYVPSNKMPPVTVYWYEGEMSRNFEPPEELAKEDIENMNALFVGSKVLGTGGHGNRYSLLKSKMEDYQLPEPVLERSPGHFDQWIQACKEGGKPCSDFSIAGPYTEWILLGSICWRFTMKADVGWQKHAFYQQRKTNEYVRPYMRKGWELRY